MRETAEMTRQTEEDNDREVLTLKTSYERRLQEEKVTLHVRRSPYISTTVLVTVNRSISISIGLVA